MSFPTCETLLLNEEAGVLYLTFNRPERRNALNDTSISELMAVFSELHERSDIRAVVVRGSDGHFCAGADIKHLGNVNEQPDVANLQANPIYKTNRVFGELSVAASRIPQVVIAAIEGSVMGGGFGLVCVSDIAIATEDALFATPETTLGLPPAQIAPFVVKRIGLTQARRLALLGDRLNGRQAEQLGIVHQCVASADELDAAVAATLKKVKRCGPAANAMTKQLMMEVAGPVTDDMLDRAAELFTLAITGEEGREGTTAFAQKRKAAWME